MLPTVPNERAIALSIQRLAAMAESLGDGRPQQIVLDARKQLSMHLDAVRWNAYARAVTRRSMARSLRRRHQRSDHTE
jgi:hypothetical protein